MRRIALTLVVLAGLTLAVLSVFLLLGTGRSSYTAEFVVESVPGLLLANALGRFLVAMGPPAPWNPAEARART